MAVVEVPVTITGGQQSGPSLNVWHIQGSPADAAGLAPALADILAFYVAVRAEFASGTTITVAPAGLKVVDVTPNVIIGLTGGQTSGSGGNSMPGNTAVVAALRTNLAGRSYLGRKFFGPLATLANANGLLYSGTRDVFLAALESLRTTIDGHGWEIVVWSRLRNAATVCTGFTMDNRLDNLNSRKLAG